MSFGKVRHCAEVVINEPLRRYQVGLIIKSFGPLKRLLDDGGGLSIRFDETEQPVLPAFGPQGVIGVVHIRSNAGALTESARASVEKIIANVRIRHAKDDR